MLDIGASDGRVAARVAAGDVQGVDVELQPETQIPVTTYDGRTLPFDDGRFEVVTIVDVLHHCDDPAAVLGEALRVVGPRGRVVIKDHLRLGPWSDRVLYAMDTASNFGVHERAAGHYLAPDEGVRLVDTAGGRLETMVWPFRVHDLPWRLVARDQYHLLMRVLPDGR